MNQFFLVRKSGSVVVIEEEDRQGLCSVKRIDNGKRLLVPREGLMPIKLVNQHGEQVWVTDDNKQAEVSVPRPGE